MILIARDHAGDHPLRDPGRLLEHAVDAEADPHLAARSGSKWMSEAPSATAWPRMLLTSLITGAVLGRGAQVGDLGLGSSSLLLLLAIASATVLCSVLSLLTSASMS